MRAPVALALFLASPATSLLVSPIISPSPAVGVARPHVALMKSQEDIEYENWVKNKKLKAGIDTKEDFGASRRTESSIYLVGGLITVVVPTVAAIWAYNEGLLTPQ
jgi:hypothetical protein